MKVTLDVSQKLLDFAGEPILLSREDETPVTLKHALLAYCRHAGAMGLSDEEQAQAYRLGMSIGRGKGTVELDPPLYQVLQKLVAGGKVKTLDGQAADLFGLEIKCQIQEMVEAAKKEG